MEEQLRAGEEPDGEGESNWEHWNPVSLLLSAGAVKPSGVMITGAAALYYTNV